MPETTPGAPPSGTGAPAAGQPSPSPELPPTAEPPAPPSGRRRLLRSLTRPTRAQGIVGILLAVVGFGAVVQLRTASVDDTYAGYRQQDLIDVLSGLAGTTQRAQAEIARLEGIRSDLQSRTAAREAALRQERRRADALGILAGVVPVTGPGVRVTVRETTTSVDSFSMLDAIQELRAADAEAIEINNRVRVVAQTPIEDAEGGILVGGTLLRAPYVIEAIGDPHTLAGAITFPRGPQSEFQDDGALVEVTELDSVDIMSVVAQPATGYLR